MRRINRYRSVYLERLFELISEHLEIKCAKPWADEFMYIMDILENDKEVISDKYVDEIKAYELIMDKRVMLTYEVDDVANYESYCNMFPMSTELGCSGILTKEEWEFLKGMTLKWERK